MTIPRAYSVSIGGKVYTYSYTEPELDKPVICMSSPKKDIYRIVLAEENSTCSCPAFVYRKTPSYVCKHLQMVLQKDRSSITPPKKG